MSTPQEVFLIDDDDAVRDSMGMLMVAYDIPYVSFASAEEFLQYYDNNQRGCLVLDIRMAGMSGLELQSCLNDKGSVLPIIFISGHGDVPMAVEAMRLGALDFLRKPIDEQKLLDCIYNAFKNEAEIRSTNNNRIMLRSRIRTLTERESEVFSMVAEGDTNKIIALQLGISERTVEVHRSQVMKKLDAKTMADLVRAHVLMQDPTNA